MSYEINDLYEITPHPKALIRFFRFFRTEMGAQWVIS